MKIKQKDINSFQERFKDRIEKIGKDGIKGILDSISQPLIGDIIKDKNNKNNNNLYSEYLNKEKEKIKKKILAKQEGLISNNNHNNINDSNKISLFTNRDLNSNLENRSIISLDKLRKNSNRILNELTNNKDINGISNGNDYRKSRVSFYSDKIIKSNNDKITSNSNFSNIKSKVFDIDDKNEERARISKQLYNDYYNILYNDPNKDLRDFNSNNNTSRSPEYNKNNKPVNINIARKQFKEEKLKRSFYNNKEENSNRNKYFSVDNKESFRYNKYNDNKGNIDNSNEDKDLKTTVEFLNSYTKWYNSNSNKNECNNNQLDTNSDAYLKKKEAIRQRSSKKIKRNVYEDKDFQNYKVNNNTNNASNSSNADYNNNRHTDNIFNNEMNTTANNLMRIEEEKEGFDESLKIKNKVYLNRNNLISITSINKDYSDKNNTKNNDYRFYDSISNDILSNYNLKEKAISIMNNNSSNNKKINYSLFDNNNSNNNSSNRKNIVAFRNVSSGNQHNKANSTFRTNMSSRGSSRGNNITNSNNSNKNVNYRVNNIQGIINNNFNEKPVKPVKPIIKSAGNLVSYGNKISDFKYNNNFININKIGNNSKGLSYFPDVYDHTNISTSNINNTKNTSNINNTSNSNIYRIKNEAKSNINYTNYNKNNNSTNSLILPNSSKNSFYKPYTIRDYEKINKDLDKINTTSLGANIGTKEWNERANKMNKLKEYSSSVENFNKTKIKFKDYDLKDIVEKEKIDKKENSKRTRALEYSSYSKFANNNNENIGNNDNLGLRSCLKSPLLYNEHGRRIDLKSQEKNDNRIKIGDMDIDKEELLKDYYETKDDKFNLLQADDDIKNRDPNIDSEGGIVLFGKDRVEINDIEDLSDMRMMLNDKVNKIKENMNNCNKDRDGNQASESFKDVVIDEENDDFVIDSKFILDDNDNENENSNDNEEN